MAEPIWRFERSVMRPMWVLLLLALLTAMVHARWWWVGGTLVVFWYLGIVGAGLHPLQSARGLADGPLEDPEAQAEYEHLGRRLAVLAVSNACTQVGLMCGTAMGAFL